MNWAVKDGVIKGVNFEYIEIAQMVNLGKRIKVFNVIIGKYINN